MSGAPATTCSTCGEPLDAHDRHVRFRLPSIVLATEPQERGPGTWMSHGSATESVMLQVPDVGMFVRCLLPINLSGGCRVTFGLWVAVEPPVFHRTFEVWWDDDAYPSLQVDGWLANSLPVLGRLSAPVRATVLDPEHTPTVVDSSDPVVRGALTAEWPADQILGALPG